MCSIKEWTLGVQVLTSLLGHRGNSVRVHMSAQHTASSKGSPANVHHSRPSLALILRVAGWPVLLFLFTPLSQWLSPFLPPDLEPVIKFQRCCHGRFFFAIKEFKLRGHLSCFSGTTIITLALETRFTNHYSALIGGLVKWQSTKYFLICWNKSLAASSTAPQTHTIFPDFTQHSSVICLTLE